MILMDGFDLKENQQRSEENIDELQLSPLKKKKPRQSVQKNRRQLILTGNSPYLEYLPDMLKKQKDPKAKCNTSNTCQTIPEKIL